MKATTYRGPSVVGLLVNPHEQVLPPAAVGLIDRVGKYHSNDEHQHSQHAQKHRVDLDQEYHDPEDKRAGSDSGQGRPPLCGRPGFGMSAPDHASRVAASDPVVDELGHRKEPS